MHRRNGQVHDHINVRRFQQIIDRIGAHAVFGCACVRRVHVDVSHRNRIECFKKWGQPQIGSRNITASDDANAKLCHGIFL